MADIVKLSDVEKTNVLPAGAVRIITFGGLTKGKPYAVRDLQSGWVDVPGHGPGWRSYVAGNYYKLGDTAICRGVANAATVKVEVRLRDTTIIPKSSLQQLQFEVEREGSYNFFSDFSIR